jgi:hypothetical protein
MSPDKETGSFGTHHIPSTNSNKRRCANSNSLSPLSATRNRYLPFSNLNEANDNMNLVTSSDEDDPRSTEVSQKIPPLYIHNITDFDNFHNSLTTTTSDDFTISQIKNALKLNLSSIDDYRTIIKKFDQSEIAYHT